MPTNFTAGGGFVSSAVPLVIGLAVLVWVLKSHGAKWLSQRLGAARDHLYGAPELYIQPAQTEAASTEAAGAADSDAVDDYNYDIYDATPAEQ